VCRLAAVLALAYHALMRRHNVTLSDPVSEVVQAQVKSGRYKDFSAAVQDAAWNFFFGPPNPFEEYGATPEQVEKSYHKTLAEIEQERKQGRLKPWKKP
jgi:hypothetical protein